MRARAHTHTHMLRLSLTHSSLAHPLTHCFSRAHDRAFQTQTRSDGRTALCRSPDSVKSMINAGVRTTERTAVTPAPVLNIDGTSKKRFEKHALRHSSSSPAADARSTTSCGRRTTESAQGMAAQIARMSSKRAKNSCQHTTRVAKLYSSSALSSKDDVTDDISCFVRNSENRVHKATGTVTRSTRLNIRLLLARDQKSDLCHLIVMPQQACNQELSPSRFKPCSCSHVQQSVTWMMH